MEVCRTLGLAVLLVTLAACSSNKKSEETVFPVVNGKTCAGAALENQFIVDWEDGRSTVEHDVDADTFRKGFVREHLNELKHVEHDRRIVLNSEPLSVLPNEAATSNWGQVMTEASSAWNSGVTGSGVSVGVVDTIVDVSHPQLQPNILVNTGEIPNNGIDDDHNGVVDDYYGAQFLTDQTNLATDAYDHATHVSGIIAAQHSSGTVKGIAPSSKIIPAGFINGNSGGNLSDAIVALQYAASRGAKIINASWGGSSCSQSLMTAFQKLESQGVLVVVAAGNNGLVLDSTPEYPAAYNLSSQITVAASTVNDYLIYFSNRSFNFVHLAAPGESIYSTLPHSNAGYMSGTSMAAPFVSGAAALLWSAKPNATALQIKTALMNSVDITPGHDYPVVSRGRLNIRKALTEISRLVP